MHDLLFLPLNDIYNFVLFFLLRNILHHFRNMFYNIIASTSLYLQ
jgi:hypothetical protein